jgi:hypothetical protein
LLVLLSLVSCVHAVLVVVGNKADLEKFRKVSKTAAEDYARNIGALGYVEASAKVPSPHLLFSFPFSLSLFRLHNSHPHDLFWCDVVLDPTVLTCGASCRHVVRGWMGADGGRDRRDIPQRGTQTKREASGVARRGGFISLPVWRSTAGGRFGRRHRQKMLHIVVPC